MRVFGALAALSLAAWTLLLAGGAARIGADFCGAAHASLLTGLSFRLALASPAALAGGWGLMLLAMMPPLIVRPLQHVGEQSLARRRLRAQLSFGLGYAAVWLAVGLVVQPLALALVCLWPGAPWTGAGLALLGAAVWQASPAKQACLNACHRLPSLRAFGAAADLDALAYGARHAGWCVGACAPLMLAAESAHAGAGLIAAMPPVALFVLAERFERPGPFAWRLRVPRRLALVAANLALRAAVVL